MRLYPNTYNIKVTRKEKEYAGVKLHMENPVRFVIHTKAKAENTKVEILFILNQKLLLNLKTVWKTRYA